jgi:putative acetyltransferase
MRTSRQGVRAERRKADSQEKDLLKITAATSPDEIRIAQDLLLEYWDCFGFDPSFQNFSIEVSGLPGKYAPPGGRIALAMVDNRAVGCIAFRQVDKYRCEAKRLYVRSQFRGLGIGWELLKWLISEAQNAGYIEMVGDTMPFMADALAMYRRFGFRQIGPYVAEPTPGAIYLSLDLVELPSNLVASEDAEAAQ